jgi:hypothetical protein
VRISVNQEDVGYSAFKEIVDTHHIDCFFGGVEQHLVETADEEAGLIVKCVPDAEGRPQIDPTNSDQIWMETLTGDVVIKLRKKV